MSLSEFARWSDYLSFGTFLERLLDRHLAQIATLLFNAHFKPRRKVADFLMLAQPPKPQPTGDQLFAKMKAMVLATGGEIIDNRGRKD
jgi:hypothetical protein